MTERLRPFSFVISRGDEATTFTSYALNERAARARAHDWAQARDWTLEEAIP